MWKDLSLKEKAELIKLYVSNGITNRRDIIADYDNSVVANKFDGPSGDTTDGTNLMQRVQDVLVQNAGKEEYIQARGGNINLFDLGGSEENTPAVSLMKHFTKSGDSDVGVDVGAPEASVPYSEGFMWTIPGITDKESVNVPERQYLHRSTSLPDWLRDVSGWFANPNRSLFDRNRYIDARLYHDPETKQVFFASNSELAERDGLERLDYNTALSSYLPQKSTINAKFIGGTPQQARLAMISTIPGFSDKVYQRAAAYGIDPNLLLHRIMKEGFADFAISGYNDLLYADEQAQYLKDLWNMPYGGYHTFGLDYVGDELAEGKYTLLDKNARWSDDGELVDTEGGNRRVMHHTPIAKNLSSAIEMMAAAMKYRQDLVNKKYGKTGDDANIWTNAAYNRGIAGSHMDDEDFIRAEYSYPKYYDASGKLLAHGGRINRFDFGGQLNQYGLGSWLKSRVAPAYDAPTFDKAFRQARIDGRSYFKWNGNRYSTELAPNPFVKAARAWDTDGDLAKLDFVMQIIRDPKGVFDYYNETYSPEKGYKSVNKKIRNYDIDTMYSLGTKGIEGLVIPRNSDFGVGDEIWNELNNSKLSYAQKVGILANSFHETDGWTALKQYGDGPASGVFMMEDAERKNYNKWLKDNGYMDSAANQTKYVVGLFNNMDSSLQTPWDRAGSKQEEIRKYKDEGEARKKGYRSAYNHLYYTTNRARKDWKSDNIDDTVTAFEGLYERAGKPQLENRKRIAVLLTQKYKK